MQLTTDLISWYAKWFFFTIENLSKVSGFFQSCYKMQKKLQPPSEMSGFSFQENYWINLCKVYDTVLWTHVGGLLEPDKEPDKGTLKKSKRASSQTFGD